MESIPSFLPAFIRPVDGKKTIDIAHLEYHLTTRARETDHGGNNVIRRSLIKLNFNASYTSNGSCPVFFASSPRLPVEIEEAVAIDPSEFNTLKGEEEQYN